MAREFTVGPAVAIDMGANVIGNVADPLADQDAATKKYVDDNAGGSGVPDPSGEPDGQWLRTASGAAVWQTVSSFPPSAHHTSHENGGSDEIDLGGLSGTPQALTDHLGDTSDAHDASAISIADSGGYYTGTDVEAALQEIGAGSVGGGSGTTIGRSQLVYRYTVTGTDKASIDTGSDTADAGDNVWTGGDLLEIFAMIRTDDAGAQALGLFRFNNDSGSNYDRQTIRGNNTSAVAAAGLAGTSVIFNVHGSGGLSGQASSIHIVVPNYAGTTFNKSGMLQQGLTDSAAGNNFSEMWSFGWRSTSAISRFALLANSGQKLKVGSQLLIYKRLAS